MGFRYLMLSIIGFGGGFLVAGGVIALVVGLGIITRFAGISHTAVHNRAYETAVLLGGFYGNAATVYSLSLPGGRVGLAIQGLTAGMYVGAWIMALAEVVNMFPVFARRIGLTKGCSLMVLSIALGKVTGSLMHFYMGW